MLHPDDSNDSVTLQLALTLRHLEGERRARSQAEALLEAKSLELQQKHQELLRANGSKCALLAHMSNEIRTPVKVVVDILDALSGTPLDAKQIDYLTVAHTSADGLLRLIDDLVDLSKIEAGQMTIECVDFDLHAVIDRVVILWAQKAQVSNLKLTAVVDSNLPRWLGGDSARLTRVLSTLIGNALQRTNQGSVTLRVNLNENVGIGADDCVSVRFAIEDSAIGMSDEVRQNLFTAFAHADGSSHYGSGLGLPLCHQLAKLMGGEIVVQSELGGGNCFSFNIKMRSTTDQDTVTMHYAHERRSGKTVRTLSGYALVVDDNDNNRQVALAILKRLGVRADSVADGQQAVQAVHLNKYDLVLMDCHMPVLDGYEATTAIRLWEAEERRPTLPVIALTASAFAEDRERCAACGMNDILPKPVSLFALRKMMERWLPSADRNTESANLPIRSPHETENRSRSDHQEIDSVYSSNAEVHIDHEQFNEMRLLLGTGFAEFVARFHVNVRDGITAMRAASNVQDAQALKRIAKKLKGSAGTLGIKSVRRQCAELEARARDNSMTDVAKQIEGLGSIYGQVVAALNAELAAPTPKQSRRR